ncbi:NUDIX domain-containing protein [Patescibacteria group bacterium]|nr:NUDIX domain-containing protein [Patescibacteria group bacterium]
MAEKYEKFHIGINVFVVRNKKLLLGKRKNVYGAGTWGLPGGHLEYGESMRGAAARELEEEVGLEAREFKFAGLINDVRKDEHYLQVGFLAKDMEDKEPILNEPERCYEWKWFDLDNLPEKIFPGHIKQIQIFKKESYFSDK